MSKQNPAINDRVRINDSSVPSKNGQSGRLVRLADSRMPLEGENRFKVKLDNGDYYVTRYTTDLVWLDEVAAGESTIPAPKGAKDGAGVAAVVGNLVDDNKANAILAARVEAGKTVLKQVQERLLPMLPGPIAAHADHPITGIIVANAIAATQKQLAPGNAKAAVVTDCVMKAAMLEAGAALNLPETINGFIDKAIEGLDFSKLGLPGSTK
jgi:hypothetical protein